jgi:regulatory protein
MRTVKQVEDKLVSKEMSTELIVRIVDFLKEVKYLDDVLYAQYFIRSRRSKYGDYRIKMALKQKGVSNHDIEEAYLNLQDDEEGEPHDPEQAIRVILDKKIASTTIDWDRLKTDYKYKYSTYQKLASFLANRGFSSNIIKSAVSERLAEEFIDE